MTTEPRASAAVYDREGKETGQVELPAAIFNAPVSAALLHQAVRRQQANDRQGTHDTKTRGEVSGGGKKPWKQKGTGRARQGSRRAPHWVGGGTVFGPTGRNYVQTVPRQIRALARKSALNARAREDALVVIDNFNYEKPSTKQLLSLLDALGVADKKVLILTDGTKHNVFLSGRNLQRTHVMPYTDVSTYHILWSDVVLVESNALGYELGTVTEKPRAARVKSEGKSERAAKAEAKTEAKAAKKSTRTARAAKKAAKPKAKAAKKPAAKKSAGKKKKDN